MTYGRSAFAGNVGLSLVKGAVEMNLGFAVREASKSLGE